MGLFRRLLMVATLASALGACATQSYYTADTLNHETHKPRILLMPPDVELYEVNAGGGHELNALWTEQGNRNVSVAIRGSLREHNSQFVEYVPPAEDGEQAQRLHQLQKLHAAVGSAIGLYQFVEANRLPTKQGKFDWTMGPATQDLGTYADADYALFIWVRDSYTSAGRAAMKAVAAVLFGVYIPGGIQYGHASLVDLKTGQVVWFNALKPRESGDLRTPGPAGETVALLLDKLPK